MRPPAQPILPETHGRPQVLHKENLPLLRLQCRRLHQAVKDGPPSLVGVEIVSCTDPTSTRGEHKKGLSYLGEPDEPQKYHGYAIEAQI